MKRDEPKPEPAMKAEKPAAPELKREPQAAPAMKSERPPPQADKKPPAKDEKKSD
jgi:hypothetical protein